MTLTNYHQCWSCEDEHKTCRDCYLDLIHERGEDDVKRIDCPSCGKHLTQIKPHLPDEHVFIYVDDSNMWIEGKKLAAKQANLKCVEDPRLRLDIGKVTDVVASGRVVAWGTLYGSEPPPVDSVWDKIRQHGWQVITSKRSSFTNKEKQVDHQMVADITELVSDRGVAKGKIVLVTGDADVIPAIKKGLRTNWSFEIWMWASGISKALRTLKKENPELLSIHELDPQLKDISFTNFKFSDKKVSSQLNHRSAVIKNFTVTEGWEKELTEELGWPFQFCWIGPEMLTDVKDYKDVLLIFQSHAKPKDDKAFSDHFKEIFQSLLKKYPGKVVIYPAYRREYAKDEEICLTNRYGLLFKVDEELSSSDQSDLEEGGGERSRRGSGKNTTTNDRDPSEAEEFQLVQGKQRRRAQQYSELCRHRSRCSKGLKCTHGHTEDERKFFRKPLKYLECNNKGNCRYGPECRYAHSNEGSFCRQCHQWGHLENDCPEC